MSNIVAVLIVRCTHTGVYADGRPNKASVTLYDLDEITIQKNRTRYVPIPVGTSVDIPMSTRTFVSYHNGDICKFVGLGLLRAEVILQLRDKGNCGGPLGTGQALRPAVLNIERVGNELRLVLPDVVLVSDLGSVGFLEGEPVEISGLTGAFRKLNGEYEITSVTPGSGLAGPAAGSYLVVVSSVGADIPAATLAGVNLCLNAGCGGGRVVAQFNSGGNTGGLGTDVYGYIGGQLFPNTGGGGGGGAPVNAQYLVLAADAALTDERIFTAGTGISVVDGGAGGLFTVSVDATLADILANGNLTGGTNLLVSIGDSIVGVTDLVLNPGGAVGDNVILDGLTWPDTDGAPGEVLTTDGAGNLSFTAPPTAATAVVMWGNDSVGSSTASRVLDPGFEARLAPLSASTAWNEWRVPRAGTLRNLYVRHNFPGGTGAIITYTVYVNGVATAVTVGVASTAAGGADVVNSVAVVAGDRVRIEVTKVAVAGAVSIQPEVSLEVAA